MTERGARHVQYRIGVDATRIGWDALPADVVTDPLTRARCVVSKPMQSKNAQSFVFPVLMLALHALEIGSDAMVQCMHAHASRVNARPFLVIADAMTRGRYSVCRPGLLVGRYSA